MKLVRWTLMAAVVLAACAVVGLLVSRLVAADSKAGAGKVSPLEASYKDTGATLVEQLKDEALWKDVARRGELLGLIEAAGAARSSAVVEVLVPHIDYSPFEGELEKRLRAPDEEFPVTVALTNIGLPVVPEIMRQIKGDLVFMRTQPESKDDRLLMLTQLESKAHRQHRVAVSLICLVKVYNVGGYGKDMVRRRIEMDMTPSNQDDLRPLLSYPSLK